jgi:hypothetical protein
MFRVRHRNVSEVDHFGITHNLRKVCMFFVSLLFYLSFFKPIAEVHLMNRPHTKVALTRWSRCTWITCFIFYLHFSFISINFGWFSDLHFNVFVPPPPENVTRADRSDQLSHFTWIFIFFTSNLYQHSLYYVLVQYHFITFDWERYRKTVVLTRAVEKKCSFPSFSRPRLWILTKLRSVVEGP